MDKQKFLDDIFDNKIEDVQKSISDNKDFELNFVDENLNITPLICAIDAESPTIVELLLKNGANPNFMKLNLSLPLFHAIELAEEAADYQGKDNLDLLIIIELLAKNGADFHLQNYSCLSPYEYAQIRYLPAKKIFDSVSKG